MRILNEVTNLYLVVGARGRWCLHWLALVAAIITKKVAIKQAANDKLILRTRRNLVDQ